MGLGSHYWSRDCTLRQGSSTDFFEVMLLPPLLSFVLIEVSLIIALDPGNFQPFQPISTYLVIGFLLFSLVSVVGISAVYNRKLRCCERIGELNLDGRIIEVLTAPLDKDGKLPRGISSSYKNAVVPMILPVRYMLLTDSMLQLPKEEVREIVRHEEGHVHFEHIPLYFVFTFSSIAAAMSTLYFLSARYHPSQPIPMLLAFFLILTAVLIIYRAFWWFEVEADSYVARHGDWEAFYRALNDIEEGRLRRILDTHRPLHKRVVKVTGEMEGFTNFVRTLFPLILLSSISLHFGPRSYFTEADPFFLLVSSVTSSAILLILLYPIFLIGRSLGITFGRLRGSVALYLVSTSVPLSFPSSVLPWEIAVPLSTLFSIAASYFLFGRRSAVLLLIITAITGLLTCLFLFLSLLAS